MNRTKARCTLCGNKLHGDGAPHQHLECLVLANRLGIPHDDRTGWESALVAASEDDIRRALDGYRILPTLERRQRLITSCTKTDIPF